MEKAKEHHTAGGVVVNEDGDLLVLLRDVLREGRLVHEVRLPKGHIDPGETAEAAACREVCEESGYCDLQVLMDLGTAESHYNYQGREHHRTERYFLMQLASSVRGAPAPTWYEEALFEPCWLSPAEAQSRMSYPSEREFVGRARQALASLG